MINFLCVTVPSVPLSQLGRGHTRKKIGKKNVWYSPSHKSFCSVILRCRCLTSSGQRKHDLGLNLTPPASRALFFWHSVAWNSHYGLLLEVKPTKMLDTGCVQGVKLTMGANPSRYAAHLVGLQGSSWCNTLRWVTVSKSPWFITRWEWRKKRKEREQPAVSGLANMYSDNRQVQSPFEHGGSAHA
jgi:hypothetical protein